VLSGELSCSALVAEKRFCTNSPQQLNDITDSVNDGVPNWFLARPISLNFLPGSKF